MSRRDRSRFVNRDNQETQRSGVENKTPPSDAPKIEPVVFEDADESPSYFSKIGAFCSGCWEKCTTFTKLAASKTWECCKASVQWTCEGIKKIPSYCVIRWDTEDGEDEIDETESTAITSAIVESPDATENVDKPTFSFVSSVKSLCTSCLNFLPQRTQGTHEEHKEEQYDEDELAPSRWWSVGTKTAAATAAVLVLVGGYFVVAPLFNVSTVEVADIETVEPTEQPYLLASNETSNEMPPVVPTVEIPVLAVAPVAAAPEPPVAAPFGLPAPQQPQQPNAFAAVTPAPAPPQGSLLENDPFSAPQPPPAIPTFAGTAPTIPGDPFGVASPIVEPSAPAVVESAAPQALTALQPLAPTESAQTVNQQPQLQPLVALNQSAFPPMAVANAPAAVPAMAFAPIAADRSSTASPAFGQAPVPPPVTALPQTAVERTIPIIEPVREIIPQIQHTGTIQNIPPPVVAVPPTVEAPPAVRSMVPENSETAPAIPRDAPMSASPPVVVVPTVVAAPVAEFMSPQILPTDAQPIDRQLWEHVHELRNRAEIEPTQLRLDDAMATAEPALRFTPRQQVDQPVNEDNLLAREAMNVFGSLLPTPNSTDFAIVLPALENAPRPVFAELAPRYRDDATNQSNQPLNEGGRTFQSRINSEISRSPSETVMYTVQQGDTYMTISDRFFGTSLLYTALAAHNQQLGIGWRPAEGVVIEIPTAEFLRMHYADAMSRHERRLEAQRSAVRYVVQEGDTVFRLATDRLQDSTRWREIYAMNEDRLQDVRDLQPGMEILLPLEAARRN